MSIVICHSDPFISNDIALAVGEWDPEARVKLTESLPEALAAVAIIAQPVAMICSASPQKLRTAGVDEALRLRNGQLLVLYDGLSRSDRDTDGWLWLDLPFTTKTLTAALDLLKSGFTEAGWTRVGVDPQPDPR